jgi:beta-glucuronidase
MKPIVLLIALLAFLPCVKAQQVALIANTEGRKTISLDGQWQTIIDPYESGYYDYRYLPSANGYFKDAKPKDKSDLIEYNFDTAESLQEGF